MARNGLSRREFIRAAAAAMGGMALAACAQPPAPAPEPTKAVSEPVATSAAATEAPAPTAAPAAEPITLEFWWGWGGSTDMEAMKGLAEMFSQQNADKGISVNPLVPEDMNAKLLPAVAAGTPPDIALGNIQFSEFCARGTFTPLDDYFSASKVVSLRDPDIIASLWVDGSWRGVLYGLAAGEVGPRMGLVLNDDLVTKAGLDPNTPPQTWDEMYDWHVKLTTFDSAGNLDIVGIDPLDAMGGRVPTSDASFYWADAYGLKWWNPDNMTFDLDNDLYIASLETVKKFYDQVGVTKMETYRTAYGTWTGSPTCSFDAGKEAMILNGYWVPGQLVHTAPNTKFSYTWPPTSNERKGKKFQNVGGHPATIPKGAAHPDQAFAFIEFLTTPPALDLILDKAGFFGARISWLKNVDTSKYPGLDFFLRSEVEADELVPCPLCPISGFMGQQLSDAWSAVNYGNKTAKQAAADVQAACTEELAKQFPDLVG